MACQGESERDLVVLTTESLANTGLLHALKPAFEAAHAGHKVVVQTAHDPIAVLERARSGGADVLIVNSPFDEARFMNAKLGVKWLPVFASDYVVLGHPADPARIRLRSTDAAFRQIAQAQAPFVSRGDSSATHRRELALWAEAGVRPGGIWYRETNSDAQSAIRFADRSNAYVFVDRASLRSYPDSLRIEVLLDGGVGLYNPYSIITLANAENAEGAEALTNWLTSSAGQEFVRTYVGSGGDEPIFDAIAH